MFCSKLFHHFYMQEKINSNNSTTELEKDLQNKDRQNVSLRTACEKGLSYKYTLPFQEPVEKRFLLSVIPVDVPLKACKRLIFREMHRIRNL